MFKCSSKKTFLIFTAILFQVCIVFSNDNLNSRDVYSGIAVIESIQDEQYLVATSSVSSWVTGEILPVISQNAKIGIFAYVELTQIRKIATQKYQLRLKLLRQSRRYLIQQGDYIKRLNLMTENPDYVGTTDLIVKKNELEVSSKYKALVYQGIFIGETAQSLLKDEILLNFLGNAYYGITDDIMVGSYLPLNILTGPNGSAKYRFYDSESTTIAGGLNYAEVKNVNGDKNEATLNLNLFWDSVSSDTLISHVYLSLGLIKWEGSGDTTAIKTLGTSSFQTGYEIIMSNWDRFLIGPSYNFDKKTLGGYLSYIWIYDRFHAQISINTTNIVSLRVSPEDGYYGFFDLYWRF